MNGRTRIEFKGFKHGRLVLHTWALRGHAADMERDVYQTRLNRGDFDYVEIEEPGVIHNELLKNGQTIRLR